MNQNLDQRESKLMDYINAKKQETQRVNDMNAINDSPMVKLRKLKSESNKSVSICLDTIMGKLYKDALPMDDPDKNCSDDYARNIIHDYIANRTNGKDSEYYVREAIRRTNSSTLKNMLAEAVRISKDFYNEKAKDIGKINIKDLNFNPNFNTEDMDKITKNLELDEISDIIHDNVQKAVQAEADKAKREDEYQKELEDKLSQDLDVTDAETVESTVSKMSKIYQPTVYQPSLFEAIMLGKASITQESVGAKVLTEVIHEYTKLNITKALKLESFTISDLKKMANSYINN